VTLSGTVTSRMAKRRAEDLADSVSGVEHVQNNLRVIKPSSVALGGEAVSAS
jgi:osmotically-inducible protein OsmY